MKAKRCPKCGGRLLHVEDYYGAYVHCPYCGWCRDVGPLTDGPRADYRLEPPPLDLVTLPKVRARVARAWKRRKEKQQEGKQ